jgi:hypothetical protein
MLNKRTNILFDDKLFDYLNALAAKRDTSIGNLVRMAVIKVYCEGKSEKKAKAVDKILALRKNIRKISAKDIAEFINYDRKY